MANKVTKAKLDRIAMEKEFVSAEIAYNLYENHYNEPCLAGYRMHRDSDEFRLFTEPMINSELVPNVAGAPMYQQFVRWLADTHNLYLSVNYLDGVYGWRIKIMNAEPKGIQGYSGGFTADHREQMENGVKEALKLIKFERKQL